MHKPDDSFNSDDTEAHLPEPLLRSLKDYANGPGIQVSEATDVFILDEARQRLEKSIAVRPKQVWQFPVSMVVGLAAAFAVFFGLSAVFWSEPESANAEIASSQQDDFDAWEAQNAEINHANGDIPVIASFKSSTHQSDFSGLSDSQTDQTLPSITGNIYSM